MTWLKCLQTDESGMSVTSALGMFGEKRLRDNARVSAMFRYRSAPNAMVKVPFSKTLIPPRDVLSV